MRPKVSVPEPTGTEFENFDSLAGILGQVKSAVKTVFPKRKPATAKAKPSATD